MGGFKAFNPLARMYADLREKLPSLKGAQAIKSSQEEEGLTGTSLMMSKRD